MSLFVQFPVQAFTSNLSHADNTIFLQLLLQHFHFCKNDFEAEFYCTNRDLASFAGCSLDTIWKSKKTLRDAGLIFFYVGSKNRTYYKILK